MSEGIYAAINQRKDGKTLVRLVEVGNTSVSHDSIHHMMSLPQQGWDPYKVLDVLLKVIKDCESIHAITECSAEEAEAHDDWAALFTEDKTQKLLVANMRLSSDVPAFERDFDERVFDSRQEALDAIYNHYSPVLMSKNLLWDLDANTFTWFTAPGKRYSFVAFNFGLEKVESCSAVTYSFEQMCDRRAVVNAINGESRHRLPEIPLYRTTYFIIDRQNGVFAQAIGAAAAKKKLKQVASAHTHVIAYKDLAGSPLVHPQAQDRPFRESVLAYTKEGYTQERIALILAMSVKEVSASQRGL